LLEDFLVEKEQGAARLILGRCRHFADDRQMGQEGFNFGSTHLGRMALVVK
jgi:hypothetical protein